MSTKISDLTSATSLTGAEEVPIVQTGTTKKTTVGDIQKNANYSTTEQVVGTWIDGKPLYEKTYYETAPTTSGSSFVGKNIDVSALNIDKGFIHNAVSYTPVTGGTNMENLPLIETGGKLMKCYLDITTEHNIIAITSNTSIRSGCDIYITIRYTKTTD